jgi:DNA-binding NtrC family response regulator
MVPIRVDVRIIATTNRDLQAEVQGGRFREDLYYRLSVVPILIPPLRERVEDIPLLVQHFAKRTAEENGKELKAVSPEAIELLQRYDWPGNIRELGHDVERAVILSPDEILAPAAFSRTLFGLAPAGRGPGAGYHLPATGPTRVFLDSLNISDAEEVLIAHALEATGQNRTKAAGLLGISVRTLRNKLNRPPE